jgi:N-ethylmaleimide reductase
VSEQALGFVDSPTLITDADAAAWSKVTQALHTKSCTVVAQLWHTGRMSHSSFHGGEQIVSASAIRVEDSSGVPACGVQGTDGSWFEHEMPRAMSTAEVEATVAHFGRAAALAKAAGFDGIELHAASGYLIDTFLQACSNVRDDKYGGDADGRFTILDEILRAVQSSFALSRVGIKLSPNNGFNGMGSCDAFDTFMHVAKRLSSMGVAYLHVVDGIGQNSPTTWYGRVGSSGYHAKDQPITLESLRTVFGGALIGNGGYTAQTANARVLSGDARAISFGRVYMTNPDLVERFRNGLPIAPLPPKDMWFVPSDKTKADRTQGYTEYKAFDPTSAPRKLTSSSPVSVYAAFADVDADSAGAWKELETMLNTDSGPLPSSRLSIRRACAAWLRAWPAVEACCALGVLATWLAIVVGCPCMPLLTCRFDAPGPVQAQAR